VSQGLVYIVSTPLWEGWDEAFHYAYVQGLVENRTLPVFGQSILSKEMTSSFAYAPVSYGANLNLDSNYTTHEDYWKLPRDERQSREARLRSIPNGERRLRPEPGLQFQNYEAHQAPLYYILAAPIYSLFSSSSLLTRVWMLRLFSLLAGSLTIPIAFSTVRYAGSGRHLTVIPLLLALLPLLYPTLGRIANDSLAVPLYSALVLLTLRYFARSCPTFDALALGAVLGLGLLTKAYFLTAVPALALIFLLAVLLDPYAKYPRRRLLGSCLRDRGAGLRDSGALVHPKLCSVRQHFRNAGSHTHRASHFSTASQGYCEWSGDPACDRCSSSISGLGTRACFRCRELYIRLGMR
jgi:hypothetical protein